MRYFLTFLHVPLENIDESPFKNNSRLVGSLNDLQLFHQNIIITFIMLDCTVLGHCCRRWTFKHNSGDYKLTFHEYTLLMFHSEVNIKIKMFTALRACISHYKIKLLHLWHIVWRVKKNLFEKKGENTKFYCALGLIIFNFPTISCSFESLVLNFKRFLLKDLQWHLRKPLSQWNVRMNFVPSQIISINRVKSDRI